LRSKKDSSYYIGQTQNLEDRLSRHNSGQSLSTKFKIPWRLIYQEQFNSRSEAVKREREIKKKKSRKYIEKLVQGRLAQLV
jgi:putative endonuclease